MLHRGEREVGSVCRGEERRGVCVLEQAGVVSGVATRARKVVHDLLHQRQDLVPVQHRSEGEVELLTLPHACM